MPMLYGFGLFNCSLFCVCSVLSPIIVTLMVLWLWLTNTWRCGPKFWYAKFNKTMYCILHIQYIVYPQVCWPNYIYNVYNTHFFWRWITLQSTCNPIAEKSNRTHNTQVTAEEKCGEIMVYKQGALDKINIYNIILKILFVSVWSIV